MSSVQATELADAIARLLDESPLLVRDKIFALSMVLGILGSASEINQSLLAAAIRSVVREMYDADAIAQSKKGN